MAKKKDRPEEAREEKEERQEKVVRKGKVFSFPQHGVSIEAPDMQSALEKLESKLKEDV